jgi:hypothetical protein
MTPEQFRLRLAACYDLGCSDRISGWPKRNWTMLAIGFIEGWRKLKPQAVRALQHSYLTGYELGTDLA